MLDLSALDGFEWDLGNREKNWLKHHVSAGECEEVFFNLPLMLQDDLTHSIEENRFYVLGQTNAGRLLFIVFTILGRNIRVISARDMSRKEREIYEQSNS
jgi:uncharacterized DUF497 family protein